MRNGDDVRGGEKKGIEKHSAESKLLPQVGACESIIDEERKESDFYRSTHALII